MKILNELLLRLAVGSAITLAVLMILSLITLAFLVLLQNYPEWFFVVVFFFLAYGVGSIARTEQ